MYRRCPNCRKEIYIDLLQSKLTDETPSENLISEGSFDMKCPYCLRGFKFFIKLMTEQEYKEFEISKGEDYENTIGKLYQEQGIEQDQPENTTDAIKYDTPEVLDFKSSCICFTGKFANPAMTRSQLAKATQYLGADVDDKMTLKINVLIVGSKTSQGWIGGNYGTKIMEALRRRIESHDILIISEDYFLRLLKAGGDKRGVV